MMQEHQAQDLLLPEQLELLNVIQKLGPHIFSLLGINTLFIYFHNVSRRLEAIIVLEHPGESNGALTQTFVISLMPRLTQRTLRLQILFAHRNINYTHRM